MLVEIQAILLQEEAQEVQKQEVRLVEHHQHLQALEQNATLHLAEDLDNKQFLQNKKKPEFNLVFFVVFKILHNTIYCVSI